MGVGVRDMMQFVLLTSLLYQQLQGSGLACSERVTFLLKLKLLLGCKSQLCCFTFLDFLLFTFSL